MQNVEFKAELKDIELARSICRARGAQCVGTLVQTDTYYQLPPGKGGGGPGVRLKKRETVGEATEWIYYDRPDVASSKLSSFHIYTEAEAMERFGRERPLRPWLVVKKTRELWMAGNVRVHLDTVQDLGCFVEFEALLSPRQKKAEAEAVVSELRAALSPALGEPIAVGYSDLLVTN